MQLKHYKSLIAEVLDIRQPINKVTRSLSMMHIEHDVNEFTGNNMENTNIRDFINEMKIWAVHKGYEIVEHKDRVRINDREGDRVALFYNNPSRIFSEERAFDAGEWVRKTVGEKKTQESGQSKENNKTIPCVGYCHNIGCMNHNKEQHGKQSHHDEDKILYCTSCNAPLYLNKGGEHATKAD